MNDRLVTLLGALFALLVLVGLLFQPSAQPLLGKPNTEQRSPQGYFALAEWLEQSRVPVVSLRKRLSELGGFTGTGNILMLTLPASTTLRSRELERLQRWVAQGNTLLLIAALNDTPRWTSQADTARLLDDLEAITSLRFEMLDEDELEEMSPWDSVERLFSEQQIVLVPNADGSGTRAVHPLLRSVDDLQTVSDGLSSKWRIVEPCDQCEQLAVDEAEVPQSPQLILSLATQASSQASALWELRQGEGRIVLSAVSGLFSNHSLGLGGNAQLLHNLVAWHLGPDGQFIVDDFHQGLSVLYDPTAFYQDPRLGWSVMFLLGFWLLYLVGTNNRLTPVVPPDNSRRQGQYIAAVGSFMARKLASADAALLMFERWFGELDQSLFGSGFAAGRDKTPAELWRRLSLLPTVDPVLTDHLQHLQSQALQGKPVDLKELHNQLQQLRTLIG